MWTGEWSNGGVIWTGEWSNGGVIWTGENSMYSEEIRCPKIIFRTTNPKGKFGSNVNTSLHDTVLSAVRRSSAPAEVTELSSRNKQCNTGMLISP